MRPRYVFIMLCVLLHSTFVFGQHLTSLISVGDSTKAHLAQHRPTHNGLPHIVQLGYIDTNYATAEEIRNNLPLGLCVWPVDSTRVVSYYIGYLPKGADYCGPYEIKGNKMPPSLMMSTIRDSPNDRTDTVYTHDGKEITCMRRALQFRLSKGDRIVITPKIQRGNEKPFMLKDIYITVR